MKYLYNPPLPVKFLFRNFAWNSAASKILFTFDDGPVPGNTEMILKKLDEHRIKALFFCVGSNINRHRSLAAEILREGHSIGNHTMNHRVLTALGMNEIAAEIEPFNRIMEAELGYKVKYFRPPHGKFSMKLNKYISNTDLKCVMWSLLTYDYKNNIDEVKKSLDYINRDSIIVLHDSIKNKNIINESIDLIAETIAKNNYITGTPQECLK